MATKRPASLIVFGVLHLIFGLTGILTTGFMLVMLTVGLPMPEGGFDLQGALEEQLDWYHTFMMVAGVLGVVVSLILIAAGIGLMQRREWARKASIGYGIYGVVGGLVTSWVQMSHVIPLMEEMLETATISERAGLIGGIAGGYGGMCMGLAYPILVLIFMNRSVVKEAMAEAEGARSQDE